MNEKKILGVMIVKLEVYLKEINASNKNCPMTAARAEAIRKSLLGITEDFGKLLEDNTITKDVTAILSKDVRKYVVMLRKATETLLFIVRTIKINLYD
ncbi:MAG: hypothetical protein RR313_00150 [Anaerovoracaceae bacterium]